MANIQSIDKHRWYKLPNNYIYISHVGDNEDDKYWLLPNFPDSIQDTLGSSFSPNTAMGRTAPVMTYNNSGPRTIQFSMTLHRDLMESVNNVNVIGLDGKTIEQVDLELGEDYLDSLIRNLQAIAVPRYDIENRYIEVPTVALRINNDIFIKGVVNGGVGVTYSKPLLANGKYANITISFSITETDPYDATTIAREGSFRGLTRTMKHGFQLED